MRILAALLLSVTLLAAPAARADALKDSIVGTWVLASVYEEHADGKKEPWGPGVKGLLMFDAGGSFSLQIMSADRPKTKGNPAENPVGRAIAYFGIYTASDADKTIAFEIARATFSNWDGTVQKRVVINITADALSFKAAEPIPSPTGPFTPFLEWTRAK